MKQLYALLFLLAASTLADAQQLPLFTQYRENQGYINPASVGTDFLNYYYNLSFGLSYRTQWIKQPLGPRTQTAHGEYLFNNMGNVGMLTGAFLLNDKTGPVSFTGAYGRIAGIIGDPNDSGLSVGLSFGAVQHRVEGQNLVFFEGDDPNQRLQKQILPDVGFGIYYYKIFDNSRLRGDVFSAGISSPQTFELDLTFKNGDDEFSLQRVRHYFGLLGYKKTISDLSFLELSAWAKFVPGVPVQTDINLRLQLQGVFWIGAGVSTSQFLHLEAGVLLGETLGWDNQAFKIGYGFDASFSTFGPAFGSTHEINIAVLLDN